MVTDESNKKRVAPTSSISKIVKKPKTTGQVNGSNGGTGSNGVKVKEVVNPKRVLALSLRPSDLDELIGQEKIITSIQKQLSSGRIPHFFIISGPVGAGKTTLARILSKSLIGSADIHEINAANKNGVDDIRDLTAKMKFKPVHPAKHKVVILDEAHQLTNAAQNALLTETEDVAEHVFYIFCTSAISKIIPALKRRAFVITPEALKKSDIEELVEFAKSSVNLKSLETTELIKAMVEAGINSPGLVLQACERFFSGLSASNSVLLTEDSKIDPLVLCRALSTGQWSKCSEIVAEATKNDVPALRNSALGYLKSMLLKAPSGSRAMAMAKAIGHLSVDSIRADEGAMLPLFLSSLYMACDAMTVKTVMKTATSAATK